MDIVLVSSIVGSSLIVVSCAVASEVSGTMLTRTYNLFRKVVIVGIVLSIGETVLNSELVHWVIR